MTEARREQPKRLVDQWEDDRRKRLRDSNRSYGRWSVIGGALLIIGGLAFAVYATMSFDLRSRAGFTLAIPMVSGASLLLNGLRLLRAEGAEKRPSWLATASLSPQAQEYRLLASAGGKHQTWVIDGTWLFDHDGRKFDLSTLEKARIREQNAPLATAKAALFFPENKTTISAFEPGPGQNKEYLTLTAQIIKIATSHNPEVKISDGKRRSMALSVGLGALVFAAIGSAKYFGS